MPVFLGFARGKRLAGRASALDTLAEDTAGV